MRPTTVALYMTPAPLTVRAGASLQDAHALMRKAHIRHLPVLEGTALVGLVSQSDLRLLETLKDVEPTEVTVREAMSIAPFTASPRTALSSVCSKMARRRIGSTVVVSRGKPVGVFTTVDALKALARLTAPKRKGHP